MFLSYFKTYIRIEYLFSIATWSLYVYFYVLKDFCLNMKLK